MKPTKRNKPKNTKEPNPPDIKAMEKVIEEEYYYSELSIQNMFYMGHYIPYNNQEKIHHFLTILKSEKNLIFSIEQVCYSNNRSTYAYYGKTGGFLLKEIDFIKNLNLDTIKILYGI